MKKLLLILAIIGALFFIGAMQLTGHFTMGGKIANNNSMPEMKRTLDTLKFYYADKIDELRFSGAGEDTVSFLMFAEPQDYDEMMDAFIELYQRYGVRFDSEAYEGFYKK